MGTMISHFTRLVVGEDCIFLEVDPAIRYEEPLGWIGVGSLVMKHSHCTWPCLIGMNHLEMI